MEKAILDVDNLYISQKMNGSYSHKGELAIDICNLKYLKAPFTGIVKKIYPKCNGVWLESIDKVKYADGSIDYMTIMTLHDDNISNLKVGKIIKQGEVYYHPGTKGQVTGSHIHLGIGKGKYTGSGWHKGKYQSKIKSYSWPINNQYDITKALFLNNKTKKSKIIYSWKEINNDSKITYIVKKGDYLIKIGKKFNVNWKDIAKYNNISYPYIIRVGQKLLINK